MSEAVIRYRHQFSNDIPIGTQKLATEYGAVT